MSTVTTLDLPVGAGTADALLALPPQPGPHPGVVLVMDVFGVRPRLADMAARLADAGYAVLVPNLFHRAGRAPLADLSQLRDPAARERVFAGLVPHMRALDPDTAVADMRAYVEALHAHPAVGPGPVGLVGYCMGGVVALRAAAALGPQVAAVAAYHAGGIATDDPRSVHLELGRVTAEVYLAHADHDPSMPPDQQHRVALALVASDAPFVAEVYRGCGHGFTMADTAAHDPAGETRHWHTLLELFGRRLR